MSEYLLPELIYKCAVLCCSTASNKIRGAIRALLFTMRSWFFDVRYKSISYSDLRKTLDEYAKWLDENQIEYISEYFDCDDYALTFKSFVTAKMKVNAVGIALGMLKKDNVVLGGHAWNICLLDTGELVFVEPQTREIMIGNESPDGFVYELQAVIW